MPDHNYTKRMRPIIGPVGPSIAYIPLTRGLFSLIDADDIELCDARNWCAIERGKKFAAYTRGSVYLHSHILQTSMEIDHKNRNPLDNRRCNLRLCSRGQNNTNKDMYAASGFKGVIANGKGWRAEIRKDGKPVRLGTFKTKFEAATAYDKAAIALYGDFASTNGT